MSTGVMLILGIIVAIIMAVVRFNSMSKGTGRVILLIISIIIIFILLLFLIGAMVGGVADVPVFHKGYIK